MKTRRTLLILGLVSFAICAGCSGQVPVPAKAPTPPAQATALPFAVTNLVLDGYRRVSAETSIPLRVPNLMIDGGVRYVSAEEIVLESRLGEDISKDITSDKTLVNDRKQQ